MYCPNPVTYTLKRGDTLYRLSLMYKTTVQAILSLNPGLDPYNLRIGSTILICPAEDFADYEPSNGGQNRRPDPRTRDRMRKAWSQHVYWTRMFLISNAERLADLNDVVARLMRNPADIAAIYADYYGSGIAKTVERLLKEHLQIGGELITALRDGSPADALKKQWYQNAADMADFFATVSPHYHRDELLKMLYTHLDLTTREVLARLSGNYPADIAAFDEIEREALMMADYFAAGIGR